MYTLSQKRAPSLHDAREMNDIAAFHDTEHDQGNPKKPLNIAIINILAACLRILSILCYLKASCAQSSACLSSSYHNNEEAELLPRVLTPSPTAQPGANCPSKAFLPTLRLPSQPEATGTTDRVF